MKLTDAQRCMLRMIDDFGDPDDGWAEVILQFSCQRSMPDPLISAVCDRVIRALEKKGLVEPGAGPALTEAGLTELQRGRTEWAPDGTVTT